MPLIDAGIRATGLQVFQNGGGNSLQSALGKLQDMADEAAKPKADQETANGEDQHNN